MTRVPHWYIVASLILGLVVATPSCGPAFESFNPAGDTFEGGYNNPGGDYVDPSGPSSTNLMKNAGFERGVDDWEDWGASNLLSGGYSGARAIRIGPSSGGMGQEVIFRVKAGATYQLRAYARVGASSDSAQLGIRFFDIGNETLGDLKTNVTSTSFQLYTVNVTIPYGVSSAKVYVMKSNNSSTYADFDEFTMIQSGNTPMPGTLSAISNPGNLMPSGPTGNWKMVMNDNFDSFNSAIWNTGLWFNVTINNELQAYRPENVVYASGQVQLKAENRSTVTTWGQAMNYASGAITTRNKMTFTFGAVEARIKAPKGRGLMPLFQLLPNGKRTPPDVTILQMLGQQPSAVQYAYKYFDFDGIGRMLSGATTATDYSADFHTYTLEWTPTALKFFVDGVQRGSYTGESVLRDPAFLVLSLAVGGTEPGGPDGSTPFPQSLAVDYVRVWQRP